MTRRSLAILLLAVAALPSPARAAPPDLRELDAIVLDASRSPPERRAALERAIAERRARLPSAKPSERDALALDLAESLILVRPSLDGTDHFAAVGLLEARDFARVQQSVLEAEKLLDGVPDSPRMRVLRAIAGARRIDLALGDGVAASPAPLTGLSSPTREIVMIANARLLLASQPAAAQATLDEVVTTAGVPSAVALTARLLGPLGAAERGDAASLSALQAIAAGTSRNAIAERLLVGDALARAARHLHRAPDEAVAAWSELLRSVAREDAASARAAVIERVQTIVDPASVDASTAAPLVLAAVIRDVAKRDLAGVVAALDRMLRDEEIAGLGALAPLLAFERARLLALAGDYREAAQKFRTLAFERSDDPVASEAIDLAMELLFELSLSPSTTEAQKADAATAMTEAIAKFYDHPKRDRWRVHLGNVELDRGRLAAARTAFAASPSESAREGLALAWLLTALGARGEAEVAASLRESDAAMPAPAATPSARRLLLEGLRARATGDNGTAAARIDAALADPSLLTGDVRVGFRELLSSQRRASAPPALTPGAAAAAERMPTLARDAIVAELETSFARSAEISEATAAVEATSLRTLLPPPPRVLATMTPAQRALVATALLADRRRTEAAAITGPLLAESQDPATMLLHARAVEESQPREAFDLYRAIVQRAEPQSSAWWNGQVGELRLRFATPSAETAELVIARVNRLRQTDPDLGGERTRAALEGLAESAHAELRKATAR
ncbi:MAG: hypothetical protein JNM94_03545 [Phycisphaerae bacterium]|nr:hypothetical protein [Phycisphaerae bacterium]